MKKKVRLKGERLDIVEMNFLLYGQADPDMPNLPPDVLAEMYECAKPKLSKPIGKVIIVGTGGGDEKGSFAKLWNESK